MSNQTGYSVSAAYTCTEISMTCPVTATTYGYFPSLGVNVFLVLCFGLSACSTIFFTIQKRTWSYGFGVALGCILECAGYIGRVLMHYNPWNLPAFKMQMVAIILGPTLLCISIYITLKHICLALNPRLSPIPPRLYPFLFVPADISCLLIQAVGGIMAVAAGTTKFSLMSAGNHVIIAGICMQVAVLSTFGLICGFYLIRVRLLLSSADASNEMRELARDNRFRLFMSAVTGAYTAILIRCIYRIAEMAGGWGNYIMQDEPSFVVLESFMILIAAVLLAFFPPGLLFKQMGESKLRLRKQEVRQLPASEQSHQVKDETD